MARKLPAQHKVTRLLEVEWNVGRTGIIAPRAVLEPVLIDGVTVTYATLHNPADITRRGLMTGDQVFVYRAGDVIPRVEAPLVDQRTGAEQPIVFPEVCPAAAATSTPRSSAGAASRAGAARRSRRSGTPPPATSWTSRAWAAPGRSSWSSPAWSPTWPTCSP